MYCIRRYQRSTPSTLVSRVGRLVPVVKVGKAPRRAGDRGLQRSVLGRSRQESSFTVFGHNINRREYKRPDDFHNSFRKPFMITASASQNVFQKGRTQSTNEREQKQAFLLFCLDIIFRAVHNPPTRTAVVFAVHPQEQTTGIALGIVCTWTMLKARLYRRHMIWGQRACNHGYERS